MINSLRHTVSESAFVFYSSSVRARCPGGAFRGRAPQMTACAPQTKIVPPKRGLCPKEINRLGTTGLQIEAQIGVCHRNFCNFCGLTPDFVTFLEWRPFFLEITCFRPEKPFEFLILAGKSLRVSLKTFFLEITCFRPEKTFGFLISAENPSEFLVFTLFIWSRLG